jgi:hypothetical protein
MQLSAAAETPTITNAESTVGGTATITFHTTKDGSGAISTATVDFLVNVTGLPGGSQLTMAHIHQGGAGTAGAILVDTGLAAGAALITNGAASFQKLGVNVQPDVAQAMITTPANFYFNIHTALNPNGVSRGQLDGGTGGAAGGGDTGSPYTAGHTVP